MDFLLSASEHRVVMAELAELHAVWEERLGSRAANRRYLRQLRQYPFRLLARRILGSLSQLSPPSFRELRQSLRSLARVPVLTGAIILTVGVGIGGCTAIFAVVNALLLRPLPYPDADRLVWIHTEAPPHQFPFSVVDYQALMEQQTSFESVAAWNTQTYTFTDQDVAELLQVKEITPGFLELLGVGLTAGRSPTEAEGEPGAPPTAVVSRGFASRYLSAPVGSEGDAVGRTLRLDGVEYTVLGVLSAELGPLERRAEVFPTLRLQPPTRKGPFFLSVFGRLEPGVDARTAAEELRGINRRLFPLWADSYQDERTTWGMRGLDETLRDDADGLIFILLGAVGLILLVATANAANLLLARVGGRQKELAVRVALGASRERVLSVLLSESALLAVGGIAVGLAVAKGSLSFLPLVASSYIPRLDEATLSGPVLTVAGILALGSGLLFGIIPALHGCGGDLLRDLQAAGRGVFTTRRRQRYQKLLVGAQLAVVVPLLTGAALLGSSLLNLQRLDPGFDSGSLLSFRVSLSSSTHPERVDRVQFWDRALERIGNLPEVAAVSLSGGRPPDRVGMTNNFNLEDHPTPPDQSEPSSPWLVVDSAYFTVMGIPLLEGRTHLPSDLDDGAPPVIVVDQAWARRYFPGESAVGRRLVSGGDVTGPRTTVVGVVGSVPYLGMESHDEGAVYDLGARGFSSPYVMVRASGDPARLVSRIRQELRELDPTAPLTEVDTGESLLAESLARPRHLAFLLAGFAVFAVLLAVIGLYGITAYAVQQRSGDIAVRLALGGSPGTVLGTVLRQSMVVAVVGLAVGAVASMGATSVLASLLFGVSPRDPGTLAGVVVLLLAVTTVACLVPGRRAVTVDPAVALREE